MAPQTGPILGGSPAARGAEPVYTDPRLWGSTEPVPGPPLTEAQRLDSAFGERFTRFRDSVSALAVAPNKMERADWTVDKNGKKYGIDPKFIYLGKVKIPTALLALLPINQQGNPIAAAREREFNYQHNVIMEQQQWAMNEEEFRAAVKAVRARKDKEKKAKEEEKSKRKAEKVISPG